jgi:hypothetical protein
MIPADRTVTIAIGHGKRAARSVDARLRRRQPRCAARHALATRERLNTWFYSEATATVRP